MPQVPELRVIELPDEEPPMTLEMQIRTALYSACVYLLPAIVRVGHREGILLSRDQYEIMSARAKAYLEIQGQEGVS